jgi:succinylarginine dihydrolase
MPEANFDSIVGPTHNYAGLSPGNVASTSHRGEVSRPRDAALQGLAKMRALSQLGLAQGWLPPQERPDVGLLRGLGFSGADHEAIARAAREAPHLLARASSASSMWAANAATVSASDDTSDRRVHFSVANLRTMLHRAIEAPQTERTLRAVFSDHSRFAGCMPGPPTPTARPESISSCMARARAIRGRPVFILLGRRVRPRRRSRGGMASILRGSSMPSSVPRRSMRGSFTTT